MGYSNLIQAFSTLVILFFLLMHECLDNFIFLLLLKPKYILLIHSSIFCIVFSKMYHAEVDLKFGFPFYPNCSQIKLMVILSCQSLHKQTIIDT